MSLPNEIMTVVETWFEEFLEEGYSEEEAAKLAQEKFEEREQIMSQMKNWMMDMEDAMFESIEQGASSEEDIIAGVRTKMEFVDERFIRQRLEELNGPYLDDS